MFPSFLIIIFLCLLVCLHHTYKGIQKTLGLSRHLGDVVTTHSLSQYLFTNRQTINDWIGVALDKIVKKKIHAPALRINKALMAKEK